jgi:phosphoribosylformylglycinamidine cyclo-ligase
MPEIFQWLQDQGNIESSEMHRVLNCGVGMVLVVPKEGSEAAISKLNELGEVAWLIGEVVESTGEQVII